MTTLGWKDRITITISVVALCVSALGFYFQNIRVSHRLQAVATGVQTGRSSLQFDLAFLNNGNRPALIYGADAVIASTDTLGDPALAMEVGRSNEVDGLPAVLDPGGILKVTVRTEFDAGYLLGFGGAPDGPLARRPGWKKIPVGIRVRAFDSSGRRHVIVRPSFDFNLHSRGSFSPSSKPPAVVTIY